MAALLMRDGFESIRGGLPVDAAPLFESTQATIVPFQIGFFPRLHASGLDPGLIDVALFDETF